VPKYREKCERSPATGEASEQTLSPEKKRAGKNSFPQTPFLFARPLGLRPEKFFGERRLIYF